MKAEAFRSVMKKFFHAEDTLEAFLKLHQGKSQTEIIEAATAVAQERKLLKAQQKELNDSKEIRSLRKKVSDQDWGELLIAARALVLCGLPYKKSSETKIVKKARLGNGQHLTVVFTALGEHPIPFGKDRAVLSWITTIASRNQDPVVKFDSAMDFIRAFGITDSGSNYKQIRESIDRLKSFSCYVTVNDGDNEASSQNAVIHNAFLPSRKDSLAEGRGELQLSIFRNGFFIELDPSFFKEVQAHGVPIPLDLMRRYANNPLAWDFIMFLNYRIKAARSASRIPIDQLADMLGTEETNMRKVKLRLNNVLEELKTIWPECPAHFEGAGAKALLYVAPPSKGQFLVSERSTPTLAAN